MSDSQKNLLRVILGFLGGVVAFWAALAVIQSLPDGPEDGELEEAPVVELH